METQLRPLSLGEVLDRTFQFYRQRFLLFVGIAVVPKFTEFVISLFSLPLYQRTADFTWLTFLGILAAAFVSIVTSAISQAATSVAVSDIYLGHDTSIAQAYHRLRGSFLRIIGIVIGLAIYISLGFVFFVIPGILMTLNYAVAVPAAVIEGLSFSECRERSVRLTDGSKGRLIVIFAMVYLISSGVDLGIEKGYHLFLGEATKTSLVTLQFLIRFIAHTLVEPLAMIALTITYYDQRVRREGFDIEFMMTNQPQAAAAAAGNPTH